MKIRSIRTFTGPNVFHHRPVLLMTLELQELTEKASTDLPGFTERLMEVLPGVRQHHCSPGHVGGFIERLRRGTYFAHITEHVALELSDLTGVGVGYGKTVYGGEEGVYLVAVRYKCEATMRFLLETAVELLNAITTGKEFPLKEKIAEAKKIVQRNAVGPSTMSLIRAAQARGIPWTRLNGESLIQLGYGKHRKLIEATTTGETSDISVRIAQDKDFAKKLLGEASLPVPKGIIVRSEEEALMAFHDLGTTVAMKPHDGHHGNGVSLNITSQKEVREAFRFASSYSRDVIVEEFFKGNDYRVLVVGGKMIAASHRVPAHVIGNGKSTVKQLIEEENKNPFRGEGHEKPMTFITIDETTEQFLRKNNLSMASVPAPGTVVYLKDTANLSTGGTAEDVTDLIHEDNREMCERAARIIGLDVCGIDLILGDISRPWFDQTGGIIEVNAGPGIRMHLYPSRGSSRDVGKAIIDQLYPKNRPSRIPIIAITGTNGKTTVSRLITHIISGLDLIVGNTTTDGIFIGGKQVARGDTTGPASAKVVLNDPGVDVAVLETARGGIMRRGLGYDWSDVGIITNVQADHIGQDGIEDLDDILRVKSLIVERVREGGFVVLNADSPPLQKLMKEKNLSSHGRKLVLFSRQPDSEIIREHIQKGQRAYVCRDGAIYELFGERETFIINTKDIPLTVGGTAGFQIENVLAAFAACDVMEVPLRECLDGLRSFYHMANSGRTNLYQVGRGHVLVDYGHNPEAIRAVGDMVHAWHVPKKTLVLGVPGDRSDEMIGLSGIAAGEMFSKIIIREDEDLRNRRPGEVAELLLGRINNTNPGLDVKVVRDPKASLLRAIDEMEENEIVVYLYEDFAMTSSTIKDLGGKLVHDYSRFIPMKHEDHYGDQAWH
ncbi:MAG: cyanophycin synthetase [Bacteriovoracaceae bacterium]